jgi:hypothetical protein
MSTTDAYVKVICNSCGEEEEAELPFVYGGMMHTDGRYDHKKPRLPYGWAKQGEDEHFCHACADERGLNS